MQFLLSQYKPCILIGCIGHCIAKATVVFALGNLFEFHQRLMNNYSSDR